jgi:hypothetical protein
MFRRVGLLETATLKGGRFHPKLNTDRRPIAHKSREGKVKRTLERELKVLEVVKREAFATSHRFSSWDQWSGYHLYL